MTDIQPPKDYEEPMSLGWTLASLTLFALGAWTALAVIATAVWWLLT
jgi:hypothetical protein